MLTDGNLLERKKQAEKRGKNPNWRKSENKEKSRKWKNSNLWTFPGRFIAVLCILLLILWRSESPVSSQQPEVICLTEGKNVNMMYQSAVVSEGNILPQNHIQTVDNQQIWTNDTAVVIFKTADQNAAGESTVQSSNSDKVIAPGTSGTYIFFLQNTEKAKMDYRVSLNAGWAMEGAQSPLEIRMADDNGWLAPCRSGWQSISNLRDTAGTGQLLPEEKAKYILYWRWAYERGKDEEDTSLGNNTEETLHTIVIHTEAVQSISENAGDVNGGYDSSVKADITKMQEKDTNMGQIKAEDRHTQSADAVKTADQMSPGMWLKVLILTSLILSACLTVIWLRKRRSHDEK